MNFRSKTIRLGKAAGALCCACLMLALCVLTLVCVREPGMAADTVISESEGVPVPIIMYHSLLKDPARSGHYVITPAQFERDLAHIRAKGYEPIFISDLIAYVYHDAPLPPKPIVITFDDGYYNNYCYGFPLLQKYNAKAVISIIGLQCDQYSETGEQNASYTHCTWENLNEMINSGLVEIQNHTYNLHTTKNGRKGCAKKKGEPAAQYRAMLSEDVLRLQYRIKEMTGTMPNTFVYPFGSFTKETKEVIRELGFLATLSCERGTAVVTKDPNSLFMMKRYLRASGKSSEAFFDGILS